MNGIHVFELISILYTMCWMIDDTNIYKSNSFLHLPNTLKKKLLLLCLLSDEIDTYIKCSDCTCSYTYIVLAIIF